MKKVALILCYDGSSYYGWQRQAGLLTVQERLENALASIAEHEIDLYGGGRTDAGVHALFQVAHFSTTKEVDKKAWSYGLNAILPAEIRILKALQVDHEFHARFSAESRHYCFLLLCNQKIANPFLAKRVVSIREDLDHEAMKSGAKHLLGSHDFESFRSAKCQSQTSLRNVIALEIKREGDLIKFDIIANAFLYNMVRNIVGSLIEVGKGKREPDWILEILKKRDRNSAGAKVKPHGLYLAKISYPEKFLIHRSESV